MKTRVALITFPSAYVNSPPRTETLYGIINVTHVKKFVIFIHEGGTTAYQSKSILQYTITDETN